MKIPPFSFTGASSHRHSQSRRHSRPGGKALLHYALLLAVSLGTSVAGAQSVKSGEQVYKENCLACHATKFEKAPQFGDRKAWEPFDKEGQHIVTAHGWVGVRNMPARGGNPKLTLEEFTRANAYMARSAGLDWKDPDEKLMRLVREEIVKREAELEAKKRRK